MDKEDICVVTKPGTEKDVREIHVPVEVVKRDGSTGIANLEVIPQSLEIWTGGDILDSEMRMAERAGRVSRRSKLRTDGNPGDFLGPWAVDKGHKSLMYFPSLWFSFTSSRGTCAQIMRHHIGISYNQESTRFINYDSKGTFQFIQHARQEQRNLMAYEPDVCGRLDGFKRSVRQYCHEMNVLGYRAEEARGNLPLAYASTVAVKASLEAVRNMFRERLCARTAQLEIRQLLFPLFMFLKNEYPWTVKDIVPYTNDMTDKDMVDVVGPDGTEYTM